MTTPTPNDPLDALLRESRSEVTLPSRFQSEVWQRIADRESESPWTFLRVRLEELAVRLTCPRPAMALLAVVTIFSAGLAQWQESPSEQTSTSAMESRYFASIDPYSKTHH